MHTIISPESADGNQSTPALRAEGRAYRSVPCSHCSETLYYPTVRKKKNGLIHCGHCGTRTPIPTWANRLLKLGWILFLLLAVVLITLASVQRG